MKWPPSHWFSPRASKSAPPPRRRLRLESLEDRAVPAVLHVTNLASDSAAVAGTLRHEIAISAANDAIVFDIAGTLTLTNGALTPNHTLTINGLGPNLDVINAGGSNRIIDPNFSLADLTLSGLTLTGSHSIPYGAVTVQNGSLTIDHCTITGNSASAASAIAATAGLTITNSTVSGNTALRGLGAIYAEGSTKIANTTISGNSGGGGGGGGLHFRGNSAAASLTITGSTISGNTATAGAGIYAIFSGGSTATITNSTISGNTATTGGGGGVFAFGTGALRLANDTVAGNTARGGSGGGLSLAGGLTTTLLNTIVANNIDTTNRAPDISGTVIAAFSLVRSTKGATFTGFTGSDLFGFDPHLGPLQNNGGPTQTMALLAGSRAIDTGYDGVMGPPYFLTTDQRGHLRKAGTHVDIGAFEFGSPLPPTPPPLLPPRHGRIF